jgi:thymidine kinase
MFGGKTTELLKRAQRASFAKQPCVIIKYIGDNRYGDENTLVTHAGTIQTHKEESQFTAPIRVTTAARLSEVEATEPVICIDEGQFYPDLIERCEYWANEGKHVIVSALDSDFQRAPFGQVCELVAKCDTVEKQRGICMECRMADSSFTMRISTCVTIVDIGAEEKYRAVCRVCYNKHQSEVSLAERAINAPLTV